MIDQQKDGFRSLIVWQKSLILVSEVYKITKSFPKSESFGLTSQIQRAAVSVLANIAEGYGRRSQKEFHHFITISLGSLSEVEALLEVAHNIAYLSEIEKGNLLLICNEVGRLLHGLRRKLSS